MTLQEIIAQLQHALEAAGEAAKRGSGAARYVEAYCLLDAHIEMVLSDLRLLALDEGAAS